VKEPPVTFQPRSVKFVWILLFALVLWGGEYIQRELWEPDEARFAYVAGEMRLNGHWAVPYRYGRYYAQKPPILFWLINASSVLTGGQINNISARIPSFVGALLTLWITSRLAGTWIGGPASWRVIFILSTSLLFWHEGGMGRMDSLLCGLSVSALYLLFANDLSPCRWRELCAYACMGLGILTKGPVGLIVPLGIYITCTLVTGGRRSLRKSHFIWGPIVALLFPAVWLFAAWVEGAPKEYFGEIFFRQNLGRLTGEFKARPFYFYLLHFPVEFLPWTIFLPAAYAALRLRPELTFVRKNLVAWILFILCFFCFVSGKRNLYVLAAYPAASILVAALWDHLDCVGQRWVKSASYVAIGLMVLLGLAGLVTPLFWKLPVDGLVFVPSALVMLVGGWMTFEIFRRYGFGSYWFYAFAGTFLLHQLCMANIVFPALNSLKTPAGIVVAVQAEVAPDEDLLMFGLNLEIVPLNCHRHARQAFTADKLEDEMKRMTKGVVFFPKQVWDNLETKPVGVKAVHEFKMGGKELVWVTFKRPVAETADP